jgi:ribosomal protein L11 methylase PrmA
MKIIDVGCGPGVYVKELIDLGIDAIGVDIDPSCVKYFDQEKYKGKIITKDIF